MNLNLTKPTLTMTHCSRNTFNACGLNLGTARRAPLAGLWVLFAWLVFVTQAQAVVTGRITRAGRPEPGVTITANLSTGPRTTTTDADGRYSIDIENLGGVLIPSKEGITILPDRVVVFPDYQGVDFIVPAIRGRVTELDGKPIKSVLITVNRLTTSAFPRTALTDTNGNYELLIQPYAGSFGGDSNSLGQQFVVSASKGNLVFNHIRPNVF